MSTADKYIGNPLISRRKRQAVMTLFNELPDEVDGKKKYKPILIEGVMANVNHGINLNNRGIDTSDTLKVTLEMRDILDGYTMPDEWSADAPDTWTLQAGKDFLVLENLDIDYSALYSKNEIQELSSKPKCFEITNLAQKMSIKNTIDVIEVYGA